MYKHNNILLYDEYVLFERLRYDCTSIQYYTCRYKVRDIFLFLGNLETTKNEPLWHNLLFFTSKKLLYDLFTTNYPRHMKTNKTRSCKWNTALGRGDFGVFFRLLIILDTRKILGSFILRYFGRTLLNYAYEKCCSLHK